MKAQFQLLATSQDGRQIVVLHPEQSNVLVVKDVGALAGERLVQFADCAQEKNPHGVSLSIDGALIAIVPASQRQLILFDLSHDPGRDKDGMPIPATVPLVTIDMPEDITAAGFSPQRSDDVLVGIRTHSDEKLWNLTQVIRHARQSRRLSV